MIVGVAYERRLETTFTAIHRGSHFFLDDELCVKLGVGMFVRVRDGGIFNITTFKELVTSKFCLAKLIRIEGECRKLT